MLPAAMSICGSVVTATTPSPPSGVVWLLQSEVKPRTPPGQG